MTDTEAIFSHLTVGIRNFERAAAYLGDPDGNKIQAVCHRAED
ncbi:MAG: hypothetical protein VCD66_03390 [Alphaproteobacteria bacterium]|jgi:hypothetical protein